MHTYNDPVLREAITCLRQNVRSEAELSNRTYAIDVYEYPRCLWVMRLSVRHRTVKNVYEGDKLSKSTHISGVTWAIEFIFWVQQWHWTDGDYNMSLNTIS